MPARPRLFTIHESATITNALAECMRQYLEQPEPEHAAEQPTTDTD